MTIRELIKKLQKHDPDAEVGVAESSYEWENALVIAEGDDVDNYPEIAIGSL